MNTIQCEGYYELTKKFIFEKTQQNHLPSHINDLFVEYHKSLTNSNSLETYTKVNKIYSEFRKNETDQFNKSMFMISSTVVVSGAICWGVPTIIKHFTGSKHKALDYISTFGMYTTGVGILHDVRNWPLIIYL